MQRSNTPVKTKVIFAGKVRRYNGIPRWKQLADIPMTLRNIGDIFLLFIGFLQSIFLIATIRPDVVFTKGGFVCVPVGCTAKLFGIPLVIHDSDAHPGLTNRLLARYARFIATGAPLENYAYPTAISHYVGIPVSTAYTPASVAERTILKRQLGYDASRLLVLVTGGGLGAKRINDAVISQAKLLTKDAQIVHLTGVKHVDDVKERTKNYHHYDALAFAQETMPDLVRAADVVVTRAGATTLLELAAAARPVIIVPNPLLTNGHQLKNAAVYAKRKAAIVLDENALEKRPELLTQAVIGLLNNEAVRTQLSNAIKELAKPNAAHDVAVLISRAAKSEVQ